MLEELIGARLTKIDESGFEVLLTNGEKRNFVFEEDYGDCCGYNDIKTNLTISDDELAKNPIITEVVRANPMKPKFYDDCDVIEITLMGEDKPIAEILCESGSGSGWQYGAFCWVRCIETSETETLTSW